MPAVRRLGSIRKQQAVSAADLWITRLRDAAGVTTPASELYQGDHWKAATEAAAVAASADGRAWVASAGYGLIPFDAPVRPYSATFASGDPDSVSRLLAPEGEVVQAAWWSAVAGWEGPSAGAPRLVADVAARYPADLLVVTLSEPYLRALTPDLVAARAGLSSPDRLLVLCGGAPPEHALAANLVRWDSRVQLVAGALASMNARVARRLLHEVQPRRLTLSTARERVAAWVATAPSRSRPDRQRVSDEDVREFIRDRLTAFPQLSPSALHREFRDSGLACERLRFLSLLRTVTEE
ncbi:MAG TPA: hypothetical protein VH092_05525 [Urbifossiella sp.]|nr:hypothetical protein [Urbifossiella sp.]